MKAIRECSQEAFQWIQPEALKMEYELRTGDDVAATLCFRSSFGSFATGESEDGCWTFKRIGFCQTEATVRERDSDVDLAVFKHNTWSEGGTLELADGRTCRVTSNTWQNRLEFLDESGRKLIELRIAGLMRLSATVTIHPEAFRLAELPWMVMFGCYLTVMMQSDSAGLVTVIAAMY